MRDEAAIERKIAEIWQAELKEPKALYYLSFSEPGVGGWLGAIYTEARGITTALEKTHLLGINPGGAVMAIRIPPDTFMPDRKYWDRLLTREDVVASTPDGKVTMTNTHELAKEGLAKKLAEVVKFKKEDGPIN